MYYFVLRAYFYIFRWIFRLFRNIFNAYPKLGVVFGVLVMLLSFYVAASGFKDTAKSPSVPLTLNIASAAKQTSDDGLLVTLTDPQVHSEKKIKLKSSKWLVFVPVTDPQNKILIMVACDSRRDEVATVELSTQLTGKLKPMSQFDNLKLMQELQANGFDASKFVPAGAPIYHLCRSCKDDFGGVKLIIAFILAITGTAIFYFYFDKRWKTVKQRPAVELTPDTAENHRCPNCQLINFAEATHCRRCRFSIVNFWG